MKVGCFLPHLEISGGLGFQCRMFLEALGRASPGIQVEILAPERPRELFPKSGLEPWQGPGKHWKNQVRLHRVDWPKERPLALPLDPVLGPVLKGLGCDLVFSSYYSGFAEPGLPQLVLFHDAGFLEFPERFGPTAQQRRDTLGVMANHLDKIVCISQDARERICRGTGWPKDKTEVIWHCLTDIDPTQGRTVDDQARRKALFSGGITIDDLGSYWFSPVGAATGFNRARKNVPALVSQYRGCSRLRWNLVIASTGVLDQTMLNDLLPAQERDQGDFTAAQGGAWVSRDRRLFLLPNLDRDPFLNAMACSRGIVYPTLFEGFGLPTIEAMALGLPLVATQATSIPEIVGDGALLAAPENPVGLAQAMTQLEADPEAARVLARKGQKRAAALFTPDQCGKKWVSLFEQVLGRS